MDLSKILFDENEKPLDNLTTDGGFFRVFRTVGCIGDSLSSGEFVSLTEDGVKGWHDDYDYSWGQFIARDAGCRVYNFSCGGMTAKAYYNDFSVKNDFWNEKYLCQAYIIAFGVNDLFWTKQPVGSVADIDPENRENNADTFAGWYARIIQRLKAAQPYARFFLVTMANDGEFNTACPGLTPLLYDLAKFFDNTYVIDLEKYGPVYDEDFRRRFYLGDHLNAAGYILTAKLIESYIDYIVRHNLEDFAQAGFIGKDLYYTGYRR